MKVLVAGARTLIALDGWAPLAVFGVHLVASALFDAYNRWPPFDIPMHFMGGVAIALFMSRCVLAVFPAIDRLERGRLLDALLVTTLTISAAVSWEFAEFALDRLSGSNIQIGLGNTMQDLAFGIVGGVTFVALRATQTRPATFRYVDRPIR